ncbi:OLC1v1019908C1 [Oldenlandia corymbosa var. corymbosa]|uniref:OLC1v1019908C1 n=1 Tax=Oldenlandia corymbosa var. corymbosa TaxID=529605 RepID=A0AAV1EFC0_OLDCO|nr:OLC1v1019908C1 [Oldenlandia corymbosa var. corymbosa]
MEQLKPGPANSIPLTPLGFLQRAATIYGDCPSIIYNTKTYTWSETHERCLRLASSLVFSLGIKTGEVVSVVAPNIPAMYEAHFAVPMAGAILNTINLRLDSRTISILLHHSESKLVLVDYQSASLVLQALTFFPPNSSRPMLVLITDDDEPSNSSNFFCSYESLVETGDPGFKWVQPKSDFDPITLNYTSGTTSSPKGVVHCHRGIFTVSVVSLIEWSVPKQPVFLWTLPMYHANGWSFPWGMAAVGGTNICLRKFDAAGVYSAIRHHKVTHMCAAPVVLNMISSLNRDPIPYPVHISTAGAPPPAAILLKTEALGFVVTHGYGLTETGGHVVCCTWKNNWNKFPAPERARLKARQGVRTIGMSEVDVVEPETGITVKRDGKTYGEIVIRGNCVMLGYFKDPAGTAKCMGEGKPRNGWFYTGDVAVIHPDGYLEIKDRSKDVIISGGENLSSVEVESVIYMHPAVEEAAVVARPDELWGETPCAFVTLKKKKKEIDEKDLIEFCRKKLPKYMVPKTVVFKEELPKTSTGKIKKFVLREMAKSLASSKL